MSCLIRVVPVIFAMVLVQFSGAFWPLEFVALAGNAEQRDSRKQQGKCFHRAAS
jgi:hypothetical protein